MIGWGMVFLLCIGVAGVASAEPTYIKNASSVKKAETTDGLVLWKKFISCADPKLSEKAASECMIGVASKKLTPYEITKLHEFVNRGFAVTELAECTVKEEAAILDAGKKDHLCFKILGKKSQTQGYCYFDREDGVLKITQVRY